MQVFVRSVFVLWIASLFACGGDTRPEIEFVDLQSATVGVRLEVPLRAINPDGVAIEWAFLPSFEGLSSSARFIDDSPEGATFAWTPLPSHEGLRTISILAKSSGGTGRMTFEVDVRPAANQAPLFVKPTSGARYDWTPGACIDVPVQVRDQDTALPLLRIESGPPGGLFLEGGREFAGPEAVVRWCPTEAQIDQNDRWKLMLSATDADHPAVMREHLMVIARTVSEDCPNDPPTIEVIAPAAGARVEGAGGYEVRVSVTDDLGLKQAPLLYYTTTEPASLEAPDLSTFSQLAFSGSGPDYSLVIPPLDLESGEERPIWMVVVASDDDDARSTRCDHLTQTPVQSFLAVGTSSGADLLECSLCWSSLQCGFGSCVVGSTFDHCLPTCFGFGGFCETGICLLSITTEGTLIHACGPADSVCSVFGPSCVDDGREPNDTTETAANLGVDIAIPGTICPGNADYFRVTATPGSALLVTLDAESDAADLDLELLDSTSNVVASSTNGRTVLREQASAVVDESGALYVRVFGYGTDDTTPYTLQVERATCTEDASEPNDALSTASPIAVPGPFAGAVCGNDDFFRFEVTSRVAVVIDMTYVHSDGGDLDLNVWTEAGVFIASSAEVTGNERIEVELEPGTYVLHVLGWSGATGSYSGTISF